MSAIYDARRRRLLYSLNFAPELSTAILADPVLYHRIVGARDAGGKSAAFSPNRERHQFKRAA